MMEMLRSDQKTHKVTVRKMRGESETVSID